MKSSTLIVFLFFPLLTLAQPEENLSDSCFWGTSDAAKEFLSITGSLGDSASYNGNLAPCYAKEGKMELARKHYLRYAENKVSGSAGAFTLASLYAEGIVFERDMAKHIEWLKVAWHRGDKQLAGIASAMLSNIYDRGVGVETDMEASFQWLTRSAEAGNDIAQMALGREFYFGKKVAQDFNLANKWLSLSAKNNNSEAQILLAAMYATGEGVERDKTLCSFWASVSLLLDYTTTAAKVRNICYKDLNLLEKKDLELLLNKHKDNLKELRIEPVLD